MRNRIFCKVSPFFFFLLLAFASSTTALAKTGNEEKVYAFGYATCLSDSTVYLSAIQVLDSAQVNAKTGFLEHRSAYSHQMEQAMKTRFGQSYTCAIFFNTRRSKVEKLYLNVKRRTERDKSLQLRFLTAEDLHFVPVQTTTE